MPLPRINTAKLFSRLGVVCIGMVCAASGCAGDGGDVAGGGTLDSFAAIQANLFTPKCALAGCHDSATASGGLTLSDAATSRAGLLGIASTCAGKLLVAAGDTGASYLLDKLGVGDEPCGSPMPLGGPPLSQEETDALAAWISAGAPSNAASSTTTSSSTTTTVSQ